MKYALDKEGGGIYVTLEEGEPVMRSCWVCNPAHERLKKVNRLYTCFICGKYCEKSS